MKIIRTTQSNPEYQYSLYKPGDVLEVVHEFDEHYVAKFISGSEPDDICAVKKSDCVEVHLGSYDDLMIPHTAMENYLKENDLTMEGPALEEYVTDPGNEPDTSKWETHIYYFFDK